MPSSVEPGFEARILEAAIEAERATGAREETLAEARARVAVRLLRIGAGSALLAVGVVMLVLPGPGWLMIALGLGILARDVAWAERALERVRRRLPTDGDGKITRATLTTMVVVALATTAGALWWSTR
jgi:uncharacterized protein (TIGR02611 family)